MTEHRATPAAAAAAPAPADAAAIESAVAAGRALYERLRAEVGKAFVGQMGLVDDLLTALFAGGHALLEGVPGVGKTLLVRALADALDLRFARIQCTPDLMPSDITGAQVVVEDGGRKRFELQPGPVFANVVLVDEVNRATPRTQSALLEAMQERAVTIGGETRPLPDPFFVLATQNPVEMEGTYPLPEAQIDRFLLKLDVRPPTREELVEVLRRTTGRIEPAISRIAGAADLAAARRCAAGLACAEPVLDYIARLVLATDPASPAAPEPIRRALRYGASPRGAQALVRAAKVHALARGRLHAAFEDVEAVLRPALRHRLLLGFDAEAEGVRPDDLVEVLRKAVPRG